MHRAIKREGPSILDIEWMARKGELLGPRPIAVDDKDFASHLYGPALRTNQLERVNVIYGNEDVPVNESIAVF